MNESALQTHLARSVRICRDAFPDLYFGMLQGQDCIFLAASAQPFKFLRLRSTIPSVLHLKFIEIFVTIDGTEKNIAPESFLSISSIWPGSEIMLRERWFLHRHGNNYGFHTNEEPDPWVIVALNAVASCARIVVHNRTDEFGPRAWSLAIDTSIDGKEWNEIYSHRKRESQFKACLQDARLHADDSGLCHRERQLLDELLIHVLRFEYLKTEKLLWENIPDADGRREILTAMNAEIALPAAGVEWTSHGVRRTFRFWSKGEKEKYLRDAVGVLRTLDTCDISLKACFGYGAVLALIRDHKLMDHDDDVDILVSTDRSRFDNMSAFIGKVCTDLSRAGYRISGDYPAHRHVSMDGMFPVDVFFGFREGNSVSWLPGPRGVILNDEMFPASESALLEVSIKIPREPARYLAKVYGDDWAIPQPGWKHVWDNAPFSDWF